MTARMILSWYCHLAWLGAIGLAWVMATGEVAPAQDEPKPNAAPEAREEEKGVAAADPKAKSISLALGWLARHQNEDGSWSINHEHCCKDGKCNGGGDAKSDSAATGLALLCFLASGQNHLKKGPYKAKILKGLNWLLTKQKQDGDLCAGGTQMYSHAVATIALCEAYGQTKDSQVGLQAQAALNFIMSGQNAEGGWRYQYRSPDSDMSVTGWQLAALQGGKRAGLTVNKKTFERVRNYLKISASGDQKHRFGYTPKGGPTLPMTATGVLLSQLTGDKPDSPVVIAGAKYLAENIPALDRRNCYYWFWGTQAMHQAGGENWQKWNRSVCGMLINVQEKEGCGTGSWDPEKFKGDGDEPRGDAWGKHGGRLFVTALHCLVMQVDDKKLGLFRPDGYTEPKEKKTGR